MRTVQRIGKNTAVLLASRALSFLLSFFYVMYIARTLGVSDFGVLSFALALTTILSTFTDFGLQSLAARDLSRDHSRLPNYLVNILGMKAALAVVTFALIALTINLMNHTAESVDVVYIMGASVIVGSFASPFYAIFQSYEKMEFLSISQVITSLIMLIGVIIGMHYNFSLIGFALLYLIARTVELLYSMLVFRFKFDESQPAAKAARMDFQFCKYCLKEAWPMGAMAIGILIYFRTDTVMLSIMKDDTAVGIYSAGYRLSEASTVIPGMLAASLFPVMSRYYTASGQSLNLVYRKAVKYMFAIGLPMALIITILARPIINLIYGVDYSGSVGALQVLIWSAAIMYVTMIMGTTFLAINKQMLNLKLVIVSVFFNIILNLIVIPKYSYIGASAATAATEALGLILGAYFLSRNGLKVEAGSTYLQPIMVFSISAAIAAAVWFTTSNVYLTAVVTLLVYALVAYRIMLKDDDKRYIKQIFDLSGIKNHGSKLL